MMRGGTLSTRPSLEIEARDNGLERGRLVQEGGRTGGHRLPLGRHLSVRLSLRRAKLFRLCYLATLKSRRSPYRGAAGVQIKRTDADMRTARPLQHDYP